MKLLAVLSFALILGLLGYIAIKRKPNFSLPLFYLLMTLYVIADLSGAARLLSPMMVVSFVFLSGLISCLDFCIVRKNTGLGFTSLLILWFFGFMLHIAFANSLGT